ncbi:hypothetical protein Goari_014370 [Gossypium aridum]|uniref:Uncharacterized protein n=1 Tax=Gossypium aridum TaxID=34290 RepID=A0A7J8XJ70_GOSAI|nr:hypothetical protein [Gossypium aridum]
MEKCSMDLICLAEILRFLTEGKEMWTYRIRSIANDNKSQHMDEIYLFKNMAYNKYV